MYGSLSRGYKAGGFNAGFAAGNEAYDEEHTWNLEGGVKTLWANGRVTDERVGVPHRLGGPAAESAQSVRARSVLHRQCRATRPARGVELEVNARAHRRRRCLRVVRLHARAIRRGRRDRRRPTSAATRSRTRPDFTTTFGAQVTQPDPARPDRCTDARRVGAQGALQYDEANTEGQDAYALANFRGGVRFGVVFVEAWVRNAFDTRYIPVAFEYRALCAVGLHRRDGRGRGRSASTLGVGFLGRSRRIQGFRDEGWDYRDSYRSHHSALRRCCDRHCGVSAQSGRPRRSTGHSGVARTATGCRAKPDCSRRGRAPGRRWSGLRLTWAPASARVSVRGDRVFVQGTRNRQSIVSSLNRADGKVVWSKALGPAGDNDRGSGPTRHADHRWRSPVCADARTATWRASACRTAPSSGSGTS